MSLAKEYVTAVVKEIVTDSDTCILNTPLLKMISNLRARAQLKAVLKKLTKTDYARLDAAIKYFAQLCCFMSDSALQVKGHWI